MTLGYISLVSFILEWPPSFALVGFASLLIYLQHKLFKNTGTADLQNVLHSSFV